MFWYLRCLTFLKSDGNSPHFEIKIYVYDHTDLLSHRPSYFEFTLKFKVSPLKITRDSKTETSCPGRRIAQQVPLVLEAVVEPQYRLG